MEEKAEENASESVAETIKELVKVKLPRYYKIPAENIQVLTPMQRGVVGAANLNQVLVMVGTKKALAYAVRNVTVTNRNTMLKERIQGLLQAGVGQNVAGNDDGGRIDAGQTGVGRTDAGRTAFTVVDGGQGVQPGRAYHGGYEDELLVAEENGKYGNGVDE